MVYNQTGEFRFEDNEDGTITVTHQPSGESFTFDSSDGSISSPKVQTDKGVINHGLVRGRNTEYLDASKFDGVDADARIDTALSNATEGSTIYLENDTYTDSHTVSTAGVSLIGSSNRSVKLNGTWTFSANQISVVRAQFGSNPDFSGVLTLLDNCQLATDVSTDQDWTRVIACDGANNTLTFNSGTSGGIADGNVRLSVTDNGTNTVGDNA